MIFLIIFLIGNVADSDHWIVLEVKPPLYKGLDVNGHAVTIHEKLTFGRYIMVHLCLRRLSYTLAYGSGESLEACHPWPAKVVSAHNSQRSQPPKTAIGIEKVLQLCGHLHVAKS